MTNGGTKKAFATQCLQITKLVSFGVIVFGYKQYVIDLHGL